jgi:hypothetical protein
MGRLAGIAILLFALTAALLWWGLSVRPDAPSEAPAGPFRVFVVGPTSLLHDRTVDVEDATELRVLLALAEAEGFEVVVDDLPGCAMDYVRAIDGLGETATGGWNFYLRRDGGWDWQGRSASCPGLRAGDDVLWCWVEPDERCAVEP